MQTRSMTKTETVPVTSGDCTAEELRVLEKAEKVSKAVNKRRKQLQKLEKDKKRKIRSIEHKKEKHIQKQKWARLEREAEEKRIQFKLLLPKHLENVKKIDQEIKNRKELLRIAMIEPERLIEEAEKEKKNVLNQFRKTCIHEYHFSVYKTCKRDLRCMYCNEWNDCSCFSCDGPGN